MKKFGLIYLFLSIVFISINPCLKTLYAFDYQSITMDAEDIRVRVYQNREDSEPKLTTSYNTNDIEDKDDFVNSISELILETQSIEGTYFIEISSGDEIVAAREPIEIRAISTELATDIEGPDDGGGDISSPMEEMEDDPTTVEIGNTGGIAHVLSDVGIGTATPDAKLHVNGDTYFGTSTGSNPFRIGRHTSRDALNEEEVRFTVDDGFYIQEYVQDESNAQFLFKLDATASESGTASYAELELNSQGLFNWDDELVVTTSGNVGIGTTSPASKLHVEGRTANIGQSNSVTFPSGSWGANIAIGATNDITGGRGSTVLGYGNSSSGDFGTILGVRNDITSSVSGGHVFGLDNTVSATDAFAIGAQINNSIGNSIQLGWNSSSAPGALVIRDSGNIGINTTSPSSHLDVNGTIRADHYRDNAGGNLLNAGTNISVAEQADGSWTINSTASGADNLGNHNATMDLDMNSNDIYDIGYLSTGSSVGTYPRMWMGPSWLEVETNSSYPFLHISYGGSGSDTYIRAESNYTYLIQGSYSASNYFIRGDGSGNVNVRNDLVVGSGITLGGVRRTSWPTGDITAVYAGNDLDGGSSSGSVTLHIEPTLDHVSYINDLTRLSGVASDSYDKLRVWSSGNYAIGMHSGMSYGHLNDYAMSFTMNNDSDRGFVWRDVDDAQSDGAMSLTTDGRLTVKNRVDAPIFYDVNNTSYYGNFASTSRINQAHFNYIGVGTAVNTTYRIDATGASYGIRAQGSTMGGRFEDTNSSARVYCGYGSYDIYANGTGRIDATSQMRSPIYYDRNNTSYYGNFASTSVLNTLDVRSYIRNGGSSYGYDVAFADDIVPTGSGSYNLGSSSYNWNHLYMQGRVYLNNSYGSSGQVLTSAGSGDAYWATPSGGSSLTGSGTSGRVARWTGTTSLGNSAIRDNGSYIAVGTSVNTDHRIYGYQGSGSPTIHGYNSYGYTSGMAGVSGACSNTGTGYLGYYDGTNRSAVYGDNNSTSTNYWAGYFNGNMSVTTTHTYDIIFDASAEMCMKPSNDFWGYVGNTTDAWYRMYSYAFNTASRREAKRDIKQIDNDKSLRELVMSDIDAIQPSFYKFKGEYDQMVAGNETKYRPNMRLGVILDESPDYIKDNEFTAIDIYSLATLSLSGVKYLRSETEELRSDIKKITSSVQRRISDFGTKTMDKKELWINFNDEFIKSLGETVPVVTVTSYCPKVSLCVTDISNEGFRVESATGEHDFTFGWIAMAEANSEPATSYDETPMDVVPNDLLKQLRVPQDVKQDIRHWQTMRDKEPDLHDENEEQVDIPEPELKSETDVILFFDKYGNQIPPQWVEELKAEGVEMYNYQEMMKRRKQAYIDNARSKSNPKE